MEKLYAVWLGEVCATPENANVGPVKEGEITANPTSAGICQL
jgi:hypothetical protein